MPTIDFWVARVAWSVSINLNAHFGQNGLIENNEFYRINLSVSFGRDSGSNSFDLLTIIAYFVYRYLVILWYEMFQRVRRYISYFQPRKRLIPEPLILFK